jgi:anterior pharynx defective protein 1
MTLLMFIGCSLVAFGPALALFIMFISKSGQLVVLMIGSSFFWLVSILVSSIVWYIFVPLRTYFAFIIPFAVLLQEGMRWLFFKLYLKAERGLTMGSKSGVGIPHTLDNFSASLAIGLGFGLTHGVVMYGSVLVAAIGPGSLFVPACPQISLFLLSAMFALAFITMHVLLSVISFDAFRLRDWKPFLLKTSAIGFTHLLIAYLTLLNQKGGSCVAALSTVYVVIALIAVFAAKTSFSSIHLLKTNSATYSHLSI